MVGLYWCVCVIFTLPLTVLLSLEEWIPVDEICTHTCGPVCWWLFIEDLVLLHCLVLAIFQVHASCYGRYTVHVSIHSSDMHVGTLCSTCICKLKHKINEYIVGSEYCIAGIFQGVNFS